MLDAYSFIIGAGISILFYREASKSSAKIFRTYGGLVQKERGWTVWEIETGHDMVFDNSDVVIRLLHKLGNELP